MLLYINKGETNITCIYAVNNYQVSWPMIWLLNGWIDVCVCVSEILLGYTNLGALKLSNCLLEFDDSGGGHHSLPGKRLSVHECNQWIIWLEDQSYLPSSRYTY